MKLEVIEKKKLSLVSKDFLKDFLSFLEKTLLEKKILSHSSDRKLTIVFMSSKSMKELNKKFLKKDYVTDVLSFSSLEEDSFGELVLCEEKIQSQAQDHKLTLEEETAYLVLHGFLHLLGYHHEKGGLSAKKMYKIQDDIFHSWQVFKKLV